MKLKNISDRPYKGSSLAPSHRAAPGEILDLGEVQRYVEDEAATMRDRGLHNEAARRSFDAAETCRQLLKDFPTWFEPADDEARAIASGGSVGQEVGG